MIQREGLFYVQPSDLNFNRHLFSAGSSTIAATNQLNRINITLSCRLKFQQSIPGFVVLAKHVQSNSSGLAALVAISLWLARPKTTTLSGQIWPRYKFDTYNLNC